MSWVRFCRLWIVVALLPSFSVTVADEVFDYEHVAKLRRVTSVEISPDGKFIAYTLSVPRIPFEDENGSAWTELHVVDMAGNSRPFVTGEINVSAIDWTPDGGGVSFLCKRDDDKQKSLYVIPIDGGEARKVLEHETDIRSYTWSPDGRQVTFLANEKEPTEKEKRQDKGFNAQIYEEEPRYTRAWIGVPDDGDAFTEEPKPKLLELEGDAAVAHWSPDGRHLALALAPTPFIDDHYMKQRIRIVDADSGASVIEMENKGKLGQFAWSPDSRHLVVLSGLHINDPSPGRLMLASIDDSALRNLLPDYKGHVSAVGWQDDETIMYVGDEGVWTTLSKIKMDGTGQKTIVGVGKCTLSGLSLASEAMSAAFEGDSPGHPSEVFAMSHGDSKPRRLTNSNPWLDEMRLGKQEVITYQARDGVEVQGLLIHSVDEQPGRRYPLILSVHGGPESHHHNGWLTRYANPGQLAAGRGFAVFYPNYRGSTGRGVEYTMMHQNDYGGKEFDDLVDGVKHLIDIGLVDKDRVGVTGGSYGGFASAWCATYYSEYFAASVMFVGISDQISKFGTTDIPNEMYLVHSRRYPWEDWDYFRERSPLFHFQKCRTPILIMHGQEDTRVHPSQSMELYRYLKTLGKVPVRLVFFPGEGHGNRKSAARMEYNMRMMRWFEHYLEGPGGDPPPHEIDLSGVKPDDEENEEDKDEE